MNWGEWRRIRHFDVNLFRHRHFRFIIASANKTIFFSIQNGLLSMQVAEFRRLLQERFVSCFFFYRKHHLERLCKLAYEMNLEVMTKIR